MGQTVQYMRHKVQYRSYPCAHAFFMSLAMRVCVCVSERRSCALRLSLKANAGNVFLGNPSQRVCSVVSSKEKQREGGREGGAHASGEPAGWYRRTLRGGRDAGLRWRLEGGEKKKMEGKSLCLGGNTAAHTCTHARARARA